MPAIIDLGGLNCRGYKKGWNDNRVESVFGSKECARCKHFQCTKCRLFVRNWHHGGPLRYIVYKIHLTSVQAAENAATELNEKAFCFNMTDTLWKLMIRQSHYKKAKRHQKKHRVYCWHGEAATFIRLATGDVIEKIRCEVMLRTQVRNHHNLDLVILWNWV